MKEQRNPGVFVQSQEEVQETLSEKAERIRAEWWELNRTGGPSEELTKLAGQSLDAMKALVVHAEERAQNVPPSLPSDAQHHPVREFQYDGYGKCPSFAIVARKSDIGIVINHTEWDFDGPDGRMSSELYNEITSPIAAQFVGEAVTEKTVHGIASLLRAKLYSYVAKGIITKKIIRRS